MWCWFDIFMSTLIQAFWNAFLYHSETLYVFHTLLPQQPLWLVSSWYESFKNSLYRSWTGAVYLTWPALEQLHCSSSMWGALKWRLWHKRIHKSKRKTQTDKSLSLAWFRKAKTVFLILLLLFPTPVSPFPLAGEFWRDFLFFHSSRMKHHSGPVY